MNRVNHFGLQSLSSPPGCNFRRKSILGLRYVAAPPPAGVTAAAPHAGVAAAPVAVWPLPAAADDGPDSIATKIENTPQNEPG